MQKIVDYVWAYYLKAFMQPAWTKWTAMVATFTAGKNKYFRILLILLNVLLKVFYLVARLIAVF
jgi:hypothetical protein|tara:strand:- start:290 stop:481 length:192 start_codon:yes stop_codon:yes gene_type:complete